MPFGSPSIAVLSPRFGFLFVHTTAEPSPDEHQWRARAVGVDVVRTVSFEELLGLCNEVLKKNDADISQVVERLRSFGYLSFEVDIDAECGLDCESASSGLDSFVPNETECLQDVSPFPAFNSFEEDPLHLENHKRFYLLWHALEKTQGPLLHWFPRGTPLNGKIGEPELSSNTTRKYVEQRVSDGCGTSQYSTGNTAIDEGSKLAAKVLEDYLIPNPNAKAMEVLVDDYECLPSYMRSLASWEDLHAAVEKISSSLDQKENNYFLPDEISSLDLGPKTRSYLLLLVRMNKLVVETIDGLVAYRAIETQCCFILTVRRRISSQFQFLSKFPEDEAQAKPAMCTSLLT